LMNGSTANGHNSYDPMRPEPGTEWFTAIRGEDAMELMRMNSKAFDLLYVIAARARYKEGFNSHGIAQGEAMLGDFHNYGMTKQQYRTAKAVLQKHGFATFKVTPKGTVARLVNTRVFALKTPLANTQSNTRPTPSQHTPNTYSKKDRRTEGKKKGSGPLSRMEDWQLRKDLVSEQKNRTPGSEARIKKLEAELTRRYPDPGLRANGTSKYFDGCRFVYGSGGNPKQPTE
jgi:hypothetical protein